MAPRSYPDAARQVNFTASLLERQPVSYEIISVADAPAFRFERDIAPDVTVVTAAVATTAGTAPFLVRKPFRHETWGGSVGDSLATAGGTSLNEIEATVDVPVVRLDDVIADDEEVYVLKSDAQVRVRKRPRTALGRPHAAHARLLTRAQGADCDVLRGAERLLREGRVTVVVFEFWPVAMRKSGCDPAELVGWLHGMGYTCFDSSADGHMPPVRNATVPGPVPIAEYMATFDEMHLLTWEGGFWSEMLCARLAP